MNIWITQIRIIQIYCICFVNDYTKGNFGVADTRDQTREHWLRWFGHVMSPGEEDLVRAILGLRDEERQGGDRSKLTSEQVI